jgi:hypothetical protein
MITCFPLERFLLSALLVSTKYHFDYDNLRFWQLKISFTHTSTDMGKRKSADELSTNPYTA